jgi:membrane dipeptidase
MGITHMGHNQFGDSSNPKTQWGESDDLYGGLSPLGRELVTALNDAGIMVDVSHAGKTTMMQALALSRVPVIASHSGATAVSESLRNLDDEQFRALAQNGGVAQMVALGAYVKGLTPAQEAFIMDVRTKLGLETQAKLMGMDEATKEIYEEALKLMADMEAGATVSDYVNHIDHAVKIAGIDHVGIASDFDGGGGIEGWQNALETRNVTKELLKRGYSEDDIAKIWGENVLRVLDAVQAGAHK